MNKPKVAIIKPSSESGLFDWKLMRLMPAGGPTLVNYLKKKGFSAEFIDQDFEEPNLNKYDIVGVSMLTPEAINAYKIGDICKDLNIPSIAGGIHATFCTDEVKEHFDVVVKREGIPSIEKAIESALKGEHTIIDGGICSPEKLKTTPDRTFLKDKEYSSPNTLITSFGCPYNCNFCIVWVTHEGKMFFKSPETIEEEVEQFYDKTNVFILDDNLGFVKDYVFDILKEHNYKFYGESDIDFVKSKKFDLAVKSGLKALALGFEGLQDQLLYSLNKRHKKQTTRGYEEIIKKCKDNGLLVYGFFLINPDLHKFDDIKRTVDWIIDNNIDFIQYPIVTPFPGTVLREKLKNRIFTSDWEKYTALKATYTGLKMNPEETEKACEYAHDIFYSYSSAFKRMLRTKNLPVFIFGNYGAIKNKKKIFN